MSITVLRNTPEAAILNQSIWGTYSPSRRLPRVHGTVTDRTLIDMHVFGEDDKLWPLRHAVSNRCESRLAESQQCPHGSSLPW